VDLATTLYAEVEKAFEPGRLLAEEQARVEEQLTGHRDESPEARRLLERHQDLAERLANSGYARRRERIERVLAGLGFAREEHGKPVGEFSQGWRMRIGLARVLCERADILLLDEPTNYLDLEARDWLEQYLRDTPAGVLVVSHDRYFLDTTADTVAELYGGRFTLYPGSFSAYERRREAELAQIEDAYERQQEETARMEVFIRRFRYKASKARQVQNRIGQLERLQRVQPPPVQKRIHFHFPDPPHGGNLALRLEGLGKAYGAKRLFRGLDLELSRGEKLVLVGPNGAGKSTLMLHLNGILRGQGQVKVCGLPIEEQNLGRVRAAVGLVFQDADDQLFCPTVFDDVAFGPLYMGLPPDEVRRRTAEALATVAMSGYVKRVSHHLSVGEKKRIAIATVLSMQPEILVLDEPSAGLDPRSRRGLIRLLQELPQTMLIATHDLRLVAEVASRTLVMDAGQIVADGPTAEILHNAALLARHGLEMP
jgi:ATP-binding cassette subfamily F protein 3